MVLVFCFVDEFLAFWRIYEKVFFIGISLMLFSFITSSLYAATPLVDAVWVKDQIGKEGVVMLDLRTPASYKKGHVPGAVYTNYSKDGWRVKNSEGIAGMLPPVEQISNLIGSLGIGNQDHVVLIPYGTSSARWEQQPVSIGPSRFWDTIKCHTERRMAAYKKAKKPAFPIETVPNSLQPKTFQANFKKSGY